MDKHSRRDFLIATGSVIAIGLAAPSWLGAAARAAVTKQAKGLPAGGGGKVLVVCQLSGGNDGVNTVIPYSAKEYYSLRPELAIPAERSIPISNELALHPSLANFEKLYTAGQAAIINGVGYANPNRSHFASMSIWHSADNSGQQKYGWLGRYLDQRPSANPVLALSLGNGRIEALSGASASVPTFASLEDIKGMVGDADAERALRAVQGNSTDAGDAHVKESVDSALNAMDALASVLDSYTPSGNYGDDAFGQGFKQIAHLIAVSPGTQIVYLAVGGFDTHAGQAERHSELLQQFGDAAAEFNGEMQKLGRGNDVCVMAFSEFGRRLAENGSQGTDHGAAAPMYVIGGGVKGGLYGAYPSLTDLNDGDLKFSTDFRQVYATMLQGQLGADSGSILGGDYTTLPIWG